MSEDQITSPTKGQLVPDGTTKRPPYVRCADCRLLFPVLDGSAYCNGCSIDLCPWCRPDSEPWKHGRGE